MLRMMAIKYHEIHSEQWDTDMSKHSDYIELPIAADLSETSIETAKTIIINKMIKDNLFGDSKFDWWVLTVPSQNIGTAIILRLHQDFTIDVSCTYNPDEWSLSRKTLVDKNISTLTVWSPGA